MATRDTVEEIAKGFSELSTNPQGWSQQALIEGLAKSFAQLVVDIDNLVTTNGLIDP